MKIREFEVVIVGGGIAGVCAAIASAREGANTVLIQDRPVLGGNASSEIRMHICGANMHGTRPDARETGILEEILLENKARNPQHSFSILETILWEKVNYQNNVTLLLNTRVLNCEMLQNKIVSVTAHQMTSNRNYCIKGAIFIDSSGDSILAELSGAIYRMGREGKEEFGEEFAPEEPDKKTMGNTIMFKAIDCGKTMAFKKPEWAYTFSEEDLKERKHTTISSHLEHYGIDSGFWWIELGGTKDTIEDAEDIRDELLKTLYGIWDHIKNDGDHGANNYALDWIQFLPGKRESRRIEGDVILTEQDLLEGKVFSDAVAYGGWPMDMHPPEGFLYRGPSNDFIKVPIYSIPYRCYYSKNIENLMMAGRNISTSHMAFGSTRIMGTCAVGAQAVGVAAAMAVHHKCTPREIIRYIDDLQQKLLKSDCFIPRISNNDINDLARKSKVAASSQLEKYDADFVKNGFSRKIGNENHCWKAIKKDGESAWIQLYLEKEHNIESVQLTFDSDLGKEIMTTLSQQVKRNQREGLPETLVKEYELQILKKGKIVEKIYINNNAKRHRIHLFNHVAADEVKVNVLDNYGSETLTIFEIRIY